MSSNGIKGLTDSQLSYLIVLILRGVTEGIVSLGSVIHPQNIDGVLFDGTKSVGHFAECSTDANIQEKSVILEGFTPEKGSRILIRFANTNTAENPTLAVNDEEAKPIVQKGTAVPAYFLESGKISEFMFDGSSYELVGSISVTLASDTVSGILKLYKDLGENEDGTVTQKALTDEIKPLVKSVGIVPSSGKLSVTKQDGTSSENNILANASNFGLAKLFAELGENENGAITQKAISAIVSSLLKTVEISGTDLKTTLQNGTQNSTDLAASSEKSGIMKLYEETGNNQDGTITQKYFTMKIQELQSQINRIVNGDTEVGVANLANNIRTESGKGNIYIK